MAASARTLVIDGDLHRRRLTAMLEPDAREGLIEALDDQSRLAALVLTRPRSGLDFLPAFSRSAFQTQLIYLGPRRWSVC